MKFLSIASWWVTSVMKPRGRPWKLQPSSQVILRSEVVVAATVPHPVASPLDTLNPDLFGEVLRDFHQHLREELHELGYDRDVEGRIHVSFATPVNHILGTAEQVKADLILVGSHGRHGLEQLVLGSVSESLATQSPCPVMIVGPECEVPDERLHTVLFATDLTDTGICAGQVAAALARKARCRLIVLHTMRQKPTAAGRTREWEEDLLREQMKLSVQEDGQQNAAAVEYRITYGDPADEILSVATGNHAGLIVVGGGNHGVVADHSPWRTLTSILRFALCPVVVVSSKCP
ncbi:universal stress protein [Terriglobus sp. ADX1]|uniref:universal stress protein n=1 Tax=Terriglobus sp. ADX1 TaxID=2794063 RepID=UPI002FE500D0